ncbi:MAG: radical SAM protein [Deltaproteobacteria bacterium]|nr:MAG: radical SAM protein [Deltaproteobacteria bacterium]
MARNAPTGRRLHTAVPQRHGWIRRLGKTFDRSGASWSSIVLAGDRLLIESSGGSVFIEIHGQGASPDVDEPWLRIGTLHARYGGAGEKDGSDSSDPWLDSARLALEKSAEIIPRNLSGYGSLVYDTGDRPALLRKMFPFLTVERARRAGESSEEVLVRTVSRCNQRCPFCSAPSHPEPEPDILVASLRAASSLLRRPMISITGGEPTLRRDFPAIVDAALRLPFSGVQVQTNAVAFARRLDATRWKPSRKLSFFVSLHAARSELYDRLTGSSGMMPAALKGLERLLESGHRVMVNVVVCSVNLDHLGELVDEIARRYAGDNRPEIHFSCLICPPWREGASDYLVRYTDLVPAMRQAAERARGAGLSVQPLWASSHASPPACLLGGVESGDVTLYEPSEMDTGYERGDRPWVKAERCRRCSHDRYCLGVPRAYAERFGLQELRPF